MGFTLRLGVETSQDWGESVCHGNESALRGLDTDRNTASQT